MNGITALPHFTHVYSTEMLILGAKGIETMLLKHIVSYKEK